MAMKSKTKKKKIENEFSFNFHTHCFVYWFNYPLINAACSSYIENDNNCSFVLLQSNIHEKMVLRFSGFCIVFFVILFKFYKLEDWKYGAQSKSKFPIFFFGTSQSDIIMLRNIRPYYGFYYNATISIQTVILL